jgi:hypothetical protein
MNNKENKEENEVKISTRSDLGLRRRGWKFSTEQIIAIAMLLFAIGFNLWL